MLPSFFDSVVSLVVRTSTDLPPDVRAAMKVAMGQETPGSQSAQALNIIALNIDQAASGEGAICQDTGMPTFEVKTPVGANQIVMKKLIRDAVAEATRRGKLRPNSVDSITGENSGNNLGPGTPIIHFEQWEKDEIEVRLLLKGGGCENKNIQYSLPQELPNLGRADRSMDGIRKCILHAVYQAQGQGCSVGAIGVAIGGDRTSGYSYAKAQLFRTLDDVNPNPELAKLEAYVMEKAGLRAEPVASQGVQRDRHAEFVAEAESNPARTVIDAEKARAHRIRPPAPDAAGRSHRHGRRTPPSTAPQSYPRRRGISARRARPPA